MKIEKIELCNFRGIERLEFDFSRQLNLFVGINGSGKSTILDGLATSLSWLVNRIERPDAKGNRISDSDIRNDQDGSFLDIHVKIASSFYRWTLARSYRGRVFDSKSQLGGVSELAERFNAVGFRGSVSLRPSTYGPDDTPTTVGRFTLTAKSTLDRIELVFPHISD